MAKNPMIYAVEIAKKSEKEIPVGAVILRGDEIISSAFNRKEALKDVTAHAEILTIRAAGEKLGNWRLEDCVMYVTLEPCPMCAWAITQARLKSVYFGSYDYNYGALGSKIDVRKLSNSSLQVYGGIMEKECDMILNEYFKELR